MEVLSGVASGMAVASLSLQLLQSINTIRTFVRGVKGAPKELQRLAALLDGLHALLEAIHDMLERQTSLQAQNFPPPSPIIFETLRSCGSSIEPLCLIVEEYTAGRQGNTSSLTRLKDDIRLALKTKDIASFEDKIQSDIEYLHTALSVNSTSILMSTMPVLLRGQRTCMTALSHTTRSEDAPGQSQVDSITSQFLNATNTSTLPRFKREYWASYTLRRLGIHQRGTIQYIKGKDTQASRNYRSTDRIISTSREILLTWGFLSYGLQWSKHNFYGILSSLSVYPIIPDLNKRWDLIKNASMDEIQDVFASGDLHPFTRDVFGQNLLQLSTYCLRPDVYRLLLHHGLKPGHSGRQRMFAIYSYWSDTVRRIDMLRLLLAHEPEQFDKYHFAFSMDLFQVNITFIDSIEWLWHNVTCVLPNEDVIAFRSCLLQMAVRYVCVPRYLLGDERVVERIEKFLEIKMKEHCLCVRGHFMESLFCDTYSSLESSEIGSRFIDLLSRLGFDVQAFMRSELDHYPHGIVKHASYGTPEHQKIIFEPDYKAGWLLRWEWVLDSCCPGYLVVSEHIALGPDICWPTDWPFDIGEHGFYYRTGEHNQAFERQMNNKARKQRAKASRKRGTRVPGAWV